MTIYTFLNYRITPFYSMKKKKKKTINLFRIFSYNIKTWEKIILKLKTLKHSWKVSINKIKYQLFTLYHCKMLQSGTFGIQKTMSPEFIYMSIIIDYSISHFMTSSSPGCLCDNLNGEIFYQYCDELDRKLIGHIDLIINISDQRTNPFRVEIIDEIGDSLHYNVLFINHFILLPKYRNQGFEREILRRMEAYLKGRCGYIIIEKTKPKYALAGLTSHESKENELKDREEDTEEIQVSLDRFFEECGYFKRGNNEDVSYIKNIDPID